MDGDRSDFDSEARRLDIQIDFAPGSRFACPACGAANCHPAVARGLAEVGFACPACGAANCPPHDTEPTKLSGRTGAISISSSTTLG